MKKNILLKFNNEPFFTKEALKSYSDNTSGSFSYNVGRWLRTGDMIAIKNGLYTTSKAFEEYSKYEGYREFIASVIRKPSYISLETVLNKYDMLTEISPITTSVTNKVGRIYENGMGTFRYRNIKEKLFCGFETKLFANKYTYYEATKSKALFDYLYYRLRLLPMDLEGYDVFEEFRINTDSMKKKDWKEFNEYVKTLNDRRMYNIYKQICK